MNSVAVLEKKATVPVPVFGIAHHVRHAVAIDECRIKFKAALLAQDILKDGEYHHEDIKEVWFPGNHGDVGGGWPASDDNAFDNKGLKMTVWQYIKNFWTTRKNTKPGKPLCRGRLQLSDVPLAWMIREIELVDRTDPSTAVRWRDSKRRFNEHFEDKKDQAMSGTIHDSLAFGRGTNFFKVLLWKLMGKHAFTTGHVNVSILICNLFDTMAPHYPKMGACE